MNHALGGAGTKADSQARALHALASRTDLPARVHNLLEGVLALCSSALERALVATLNEVEMQLFKLAEQGRSNEQQQRCFESLREIKRGRADVAPRYMLAIEDALACFDQREIQPGKTVAAKPRHEGPIRQELSLVETSDLEESLALQEFAAKTEIRQAQVLYALGHRFGVLAGAPMFDVETLPIGPVKLGQCLRSAGACLDIVVDHRVLLYRTFDRMTLNAIGSFYEAVNTYLIEQRILRHLRVQSPLHKSAADRDKEASTAKTESRGAPDTNTETPAHTTAAPQTGGRAIPPASAPAMPRASVPAMPHASAPAMPHASAPPGSGMPAGSPAGAAMPHATQPGESRSRNAPSPHAPQPGEVRNWSTPASNVPPDERDSELFTTLRELLAGRRHALGIPSHAVEGGYVPNGDDVQSVLGALQSKPISPIMLGGKLVQRSVAHLKQDLMAHLRQFSPEGRTPQLGVEDSDTIDLVGMLFDYIMKNVRPDGSTQALMTKLQVPLLRVALRDKSFFTRRTHPARQLLNAIAETGSHWIDDSEGPADRDLVDKMQLLVDRVTQEFDGNVGLFEEMLGGLSQHMHTLARKAEVTERRHVDAARGREKLAVARERAGNAIGARIAAAKPGKLVRTVLEQAWIDVLALTLLRQGENSDTYKKRLAVADHLLATDPVRGDAPGPTSPEMREEIETGLNQVGFHQEDIQAVVKRLFMPEQAANEENLSSNTEIAIKLKSKMRLGDTSRDAKPQKEIGQHKVVIKPGSEQQRMFERLKTLPFGTWFEFSVNQQGDKVRRKLAWFSTLTSRCLFVNQRGARTEEKTLEQLALDVVTGQASIVEPEQDSLVDKAWKAIVSSLKSLVGQNPAPAPA